jgi:hypothetical protein
MNKLHCDVLYLIFGLLNYPFIRYLNAKNNEKITNVNHMEKLIKLELFF